MTDRAAEIMEAITLLHDLGKSDEFIGHQMELTVPDVRAVLRTGRIPVRQKQLFAVEPIVKQNKPQSKWEPVIEACKIHPAGKPNNQKT